MAVPLSYSLRNLRVRWVSTLAAAGGIALVVMVFILVLALAQGFAHAVRSTGSERNVLVLRKGSTSELTSGILRREAQTVEARSEIGKDANGRPLCIPEMLVLVVLPRKTDEAPAQINVRGTRESVLQVRDDVKLVEGRMFQKGLPEIIVGKSISHRIRGLGFGETVVFKKREWKVVGVFDAQGNGYESEIWGDVDLMQSTFGREEGYQTLILRLGDPVGFPAFKASIESDPKLELELKTEAQYFADQEGLLGKMIRILGVLITAIMSLGAVVGAMNTMYAAVGSRSREVATLRALGFARREILTSFLAEALILSGLGGALGCILSLPLHGVTTSTMNWDTFSELSFSFRITAPVLAAGMVFALVMGGLGGLFPALRAARTPITVALRQN